MATTNLLQWNCRGLEANRAELELLVQKYDASVICLQETKYKTNNASLKGYCPHQRIGTIDDEGRAHGGVLIIVRNDIPQSEINLNTNLQAVAVKVSLHTTIAICSLYLPPSANVDPTELNNLLFQLPKPCLLLGDLNAHNHLWSNRPETDARGRLVEDLITRHNMCLWNDDSPTYLHPATGSLTSIDLSICSPTLFLDYTWNVEEDQYGSDHYPLVLNGHFPAPDKRSPKWQFHKADWTKFQSLRSLMTFLKMKMIPYKPSLILYVM